LTLDQLGSVAPTELGPSRWLTIDQSRIDLFAEATGDDQWIHVDSLRAAVGPFGRTVAHGYLMLSLVPMLLREIFDISDRRAAINYGIERVRFTAPVPPGSRVRLRAVFRAVERRGDAWLLRIGITVELEASDKPALIGEVLSLASGGE
jgi:acyl dehydratase